MIEILTTKYFDKWLITLKDRAARMRIQTRIRKITFSGNLGDVKNIGQGVFEMRTDYGPGYHIYYLKLKNVVIVLLCGGDKSSQSNDIKKAYEIARRVKENYEK